jgi:hypothetical protein
MCVLGFRPNNTAGAGLVCHRCIFASRYNKLEGENLQEVYLLHFLAKPGAEKAQLGIFGRFEAIEAIHFLI